MEQASVAEAPDLSLLERANWYEANLECNPTEFYDVVEERCGGEVLLTYHHFYEPWHTTGPVVRLLIHPDYEDEVLDLIRPWPCTIGVERWSREQEDRVLYGTSFWDAMNFFHYSSVLARREDPHLTSKLVHCVLNTHREGDSRWARRYLRGRRKLWVILTWRRYVRRERWWEQ